MKVNVHVGFEPEELRRLDEWAKERRLTRGAAIMTLLDLAEPRVRHVPGGHGSYGGERVVEKVEE